MSENLSHKSINLCGNYQKKKKLSVGNVDDKMVAKMASKQELSTQSENMGPGRTAQPLHNCHHSPPEMTCSPRPGCRKEERQHKSRPWSTLGAWHGVLPPGRSSQSCLGKPGPCSPHPPSPSSSLPGCTWPLASPAPPSYTRVANSGLANTALSAITKQKEEIQVPPGSSCTQLSSCRAAWCLRPSAASQTAGEGLDPI